MQLVFFKNAGRRLVVENLCDGALDIGDAKAANVHWLTIDVVGHRRGPPRLGRLSPRLRLRTDLNGQ